ncbi:hypothetical protein Z517_11672 [Fonsecaea pedrosoi CBS 271.37]|uniref:Aminoacyl-transfer RNA synthetases class-II family profile domain-containing protein n=1 Tax=Fonsecaea pedrosoi CBS 271.37 TaxID=1442368 RepID=A0A0D2EKF3_9EURO|nr:uncharacterized protein Z517_11672 [Fonsecaea pedrosoi CBS 271.37]KIW74902.1 hypothetical protein Z517_11672 [Fonsecaea pedrosoi CBS 271.37]
MLWRVLKAPWHLGDRILPRCSSLDIARLRYDNVPFRICARHLHGQDAPATETPPALVRHARLSNDAEYVNGLRGDESVKIAGLVRSIRKQKKVAFARIGDGSTLANVQAVFPDPQLAKDITNGAYVALVGKWVPSKGAGQSHELQVEEIETLGDGNTSDNPIQKQSMSTDFLRTVPHLRMRTAFHSLVNRTRSQLISAIASHFSNQPDPVYQVLPPLITSSDCEGAGEAFTITPQSHEQLPGTTPNTSKGQEKLYFREPKYLTVSSQLHLEAHAAEQGDVFAFSPTFRAEESDTPRHLSEFYMLEVEHRHVSFQELLSRVQSLVAYLTQSLQEHRTGKELVEYYSDQKHRPTDADFVDLPARWARLTGRWHQVDYTSAMEALIKAHESSDGTLFVHRPQWKQGLQLEHERWIVDNLAEGRPVFVTHYPKEVKPFYMLPSSATTPLQGGTQSESDGDTVACFDLLLPFGYCEVVGGSLREHRLEHLIQSMRQKGLIKRTEISNGDNGNGYPFLEKGETLGNMRWYADLRRFGSSPHGGYGLGFDRLLAYMTGVNNLREVVPFPRTWGRADC